MNCFSKVATLAIFASFFTFVKPANSQFQTYDPCITFCYGISDASAQQSCVMKHCGGELPILDPRLGPYTPIDPDIEHETWRTNLQRDRIECQKKGPNHALGADGVCRDTSVWRMDYLDQY